MKVLFLRTMQALQLVTFHKDGRAHLNEDALRKVLLNEAAKDRDVAVISVAGAFRRGKSFLLNFFLRYLRAQGESTWIGQKDEHLEGFNWKFEKKRVNTGICIWPEMFVIQNVAVVLLYTQGTFDQNNNMEENTAIVANSKLLSSIQIFNYHERLDSQDLMNLQFFLEYGKLLKENGGKWQDIKIFRDIVFLIRDWKFAHENPYGFGGGNEYVQIFINPPVDEKGMKMDSFQVRVIYENGSKRVTIAIGVSPFNYQNEDTALLAILPDPIQEAAADDAVNEIIDVNVEKMKDFMKLLCSWNWNPSPTVTCKKGKSTTATLDNINVAETENSKKGKLTTATLDDSNIAEIETEISKKGLDAGRSASMVLASFVMLEFVLCIVIHALRGIEEVFTCSKFRNSVKKITFLLTSLLFILPIVIAADYEIEVNYDVGNYKFLQINQTLELTCKNKLNRDQPSWTYSSRLYNDPRMRFDRDVGESRLVISNAQAGDAGRYMCLIDHEYNGESFHYNKTIEVIVNEILEVKVEDEKDDIKLLCDVQAYPSPTIIWKIDYDNKDLNPQPEGPDPDEDYPLPPEEKVVVNDKSEKRWTLRTYKGVNNAELIIANVTDNDNGKYYCFAKNLAGEQCKNCNVTRPKRGVAGEGKSSTATLDKSNVDKTETDNSQKGSDAVTITLIVLASIILPGLVLGAVIALCRKKLHQKKEQEIKESQEEGRSLPLIECNDTSKA